MVEDCAGEGEVRGAINHIPVFWVPPEPTPEDVNYAWLMTREEMEAIARHTRQVACEVNAQLVAPRKKDTDAH